MGMRLHGRTLDHSSGFDIISDAIAPGSIQISGNGQPIVLLADRQTTGGYPKIATVISADLPALGRLPIGAQIAFERVTIETAEALRRKLFTEIDGIPPGSRRSAAASSSGAEPPAVQSHQRRGRCPQFDHIERVSLH